MTTDQLSHILKNPTQLQFSDLPVLSQIVTDHPYFQAARAVQLKALKDQNSHLYNQKLKETAAYTIDRGVLFNFITSKAFIEPIKPINKEVPVTTSDPSSIETEQTDTEVIAETDITTSSFLMTSNEAEQITDPALFEEKALDTIEKKEQEEVHVEINTPLNFDKNETHSFSEWLRLSAIQPIQRDEKKEKPINKIKHIESALIDKFLKNSPKISKVKKDAPVKSVVTENTLKEHLMTETLAKVYLAQKNYKKAIQAYKILILNNPEKSGLFADQIRAIEKLQDNK